ncbi:hypothetical protein CR970_04145, partial [Candidatus Saccharibacteria bacterium]
MRYLSTFISGFDEPIRAVLSESVSDVAVEQMLDGAVVYQTSELRDKLRGLRFFNNTFQVLRRYDGDHQPIAAMLEQLNCDAKLESDLAFLRSRHNRSFRVVCSDENTLISIGQDKLDRIEHTIQAATGLAPRRAKADFEFWVYSRREG